MRLAALAMIVFGALVLGWYGVASVTHDGNPDPAGLSSPLAGGITLVCGLLMLVAESRGGSDDQCPTNAPPMTRE
jgi:hypothetical protein